MGKYAAGTVSPDGKWVVQGGKWVPYAGGPAGQEAVTDAQAGPPALGGYQRMTEGLGQEPAVPDTFVQKALGVAEKGLNILDIPHRYVSKPVAKAIASIIPEGTIKMAPFAESGVVDTEPIDFSPKRFVEEVGPIALDFPVYGGAGKLLGTGAKLLKRGVGTGIGAAQKAADLGPFKPRAVVSEIPGQAYEGGANLQVPPAMRAKLGVEPPTAAPLSPAESLSGIDPDVNAAADALLRELTGATAPAGPPPGTGTTGLKIPEVPEPPKPPWKTITSPAAENLQNLRRQAGRVNYGDQMAEYAGRTGFAPPGAAQKPSLIPRERWGTETAQTKGQMYNKLQTQMQEIERLKQILGVQ